MNHPSLHDLEYFIEVSLTKNISRAAERLGITQPSLSLALKRLETSLGLILLTRSKNGVQLTQSGALLLSESKILLSQWKSVKENIKKSETDLSGKYSLGCHPSVGLYCLHLFLPDLLLKYPHLNFEFTHDLSRKITDDVINFKTDFGLVINPTQHPDLILKKITTDQVGFWSMSSKSAHKKNITLLCDENLAQTQALIKKMSQSHTIKRILHIPNLEIIASLTSKGAGIGILPSKVAKNFNSKSFPLEPLDSSWPTYNDELYLIYRADTQKTKSSKILIHFIFEKLKSSFNT